MGSTHMRIESNHAYKSLGAIRTDTLPDFVIISGLNGSGKSQLLMGIHENLIHLLEDKKRLLPVKYVDHNTLSPNDSVIVSQEVLISHVQQVINFYNLYKNHKARNPTVDLESIRNEPRYIRIIDEIAEVTGKNIDDLDNEDFFKYYPLRDEWTHDVFYQNFSEIFKRYQVKQYENDFNQFRNQKWGDVAFLSEEEFKRLYGEPPWLFVNQIIREAGLDYQVNCPHNEHPSAPFELKLISDVTGAEVRFSDLSSGEKVIMSLALALYNSDFDITFPKALLMDEPDSHLHPSMTKQFLNVIENVFVKKKGVKVIMTTHSPSTVALAPEDSLFIMNKTGERISKASKDNAIRLLTSGVPTLSISYENRRQVFVESKYDVFYFEKVYEKLKYKLVPEISINFISSGSGGSGSCEGVKEVVNKLSGSGNRSVYGIIDWDTKNTGNEHVKVLGKDKRHSLENYIFDPILLAAFLLREKFIKRPALGLDEDERYTDFQTFDETKLQRIADYIVNQVRTRVGNPSDTELDEVQYVCGKKIRLPSWFLRIQGHHLEDVVKELFPELKRYTREGELKEQIIIKVIDDIPDFISQDVFVVLQRCSCGCDSVAAVLEPAADV